MRILVRSPNWIGDQILAFPFFHYLRKNYPQAHITVACVPWVQAVQYRDLVNEVLLLPRPFDSTLGSKWKALETGGRILKEAGPWDLTILLTDSLSSALLGWKSGAKIRRGYGGDARNIFLSEKPRKSPFHHRTDQYLALLPEGSRTGFDARSFWGIRALNDLEDDIPGELESFNPEKSWSDSVALDPPSESYFVVAPGSNAESRRWSVEKFQALIREVHRATGLSSVVVGGASEAPLGAWLSEDETLKVSDRTGEGTPASYWKIFRNARFTLSNDSGLAHVAALCGSPVQLIWGAGNPKRTEPLGPGLVRTLFNPISCWPCEQNTCSRAQGQKLECLSGIQPEAVMKEIIKLGVIRTWDRN